MTLRRPRAKGVASLLLAVVLIGIVLVLWWKLAYVYNLEGGHASLVWKKQPFGDLTIDARSPGGQLAYNLGRVPRSRQFLPIPFNDGELFLLLYIVVGAWGLISLYMAFYYLRKRAP